MEASRLLRCTRIHAGLTQRELAEASGVTQSTIGRIETGRVDPSVGMLSRLLRACGYDLAVEPLLGNGVDRTQIRARLARSPTARIRCLTQEAEALEVLRRARPKPVSPPISSM
jgi:transcriptional regulator with XRE-family HTH domain